MVAQIRYVNDSGVKTKDPKTVSSSHNVRDLPYTTYAKNKTDSFTLPLSVRYRKKKTIGVRKK